MLLAEINGKGCSTSYSMQNKSGRFRRAIRRNTTGYSGRSHCEPCSVFCGKTRYCLNMCWLIRVPTAWSVPDGVLHLLPFDALRVPNGNYLLQSSVVTYVPSATVLYFLRTSRKGTVPSLPFLGIGDVVYNADQRKELADSGGARQSRGRGLYDLVGATFRALPGTRDEVLAASQIFGPRSVVLLGAAATETAFKSQPLAKFGILHLAVHGIFSPKYPERSALVLGRDGNTGEDGLLQTREITNLVLNADLVTLSACDTGAGRLQGEEGIASLQ